MIKSIKLSVLFLLPRSFIIYKKQIIVIAKHRYTIITLDVQVQQPQYSQPYPNLFDDFVMLIKQQ